MSYVTQNKKDRASAMSMAVLINGSIILAVALSPIVATQVRNGHRTEIFDVLRDPPKPPPPEHTDDPKPVDSVYTPPVSTELPPTKNDISTTPDPTPPQPPVGGMGTSIEPPLPPVIEKPPLPPAPFTAATRDPRFAANFQPAYPHKMEQRQVEGSVKVKVLIGRDGRVRQVQILSATDPAFAEATEKQALKAWRFRPATRGSEAVEDWQTLTVRFTINT